MTTSGSDCLSSTPSRNRAPFSEIPAKPPGRTGLARPEVRSVSVQSRPRGPTASKVRSANGRSGPPDRQKQPTPQEEAPQGYRPGAHHSAPPEAGGPRPPPLARLPFFHSRRNATLRGLEICPGEWTSATYFCRDVEHQTPRGAGSHGVARGGDRDAGAAALITRGVSSPLRMLRLGRRTHQGSDRTAERSRGQLPVQLGNAAARLALTGQPAARSPKSTNTKCSTAMQRTRPRPAGREGGGEGRRARSPLTAHGQSLTPTCAPGKGRAGLQRSLCPSGAPFCPLTGGRTSTCQYRCEGPAPRNLC